MQEQLISFETAKLAKEKGFDISSDKGYYTHGESVLKLWTDGENWNNQKDFLCYCPTQSLLQKWLREIHKISVEVHVGEDEWEVEIFSIIGFSIMISSGVIYETYEEALELGLQEALKLI